MNKKSLANLKPAKKGEVRNPKGRPITLDVKNITVCLPKKLLARLDSQYSNRSEAIRNALELLLD